LFRVLRQDGFADFQESYGRDETYMSQFLEQTKLDNLQYMFDGGFTSTERVAGSSFLGAWYGLGNPLTANNVAFE